MAEKLNIPELKLEYYLGQAKRFNKVTFVTTLIDAVLGLVTLFSAFILSQYFALLASILSGVMICIGFAGFNKVKKLVKGAAFISEERLSKLNLEKQLYNKAGILWSILDVVLGIVAIIFIGLTVNETLAVKSAAYIPFIHEVQIIFRISNSARLNSAIKVAGTVSIIYVATRKTHWLKGEKTQMWNKVKNLFKWFVKSNPKTITGIFAAIGSVVTAAIANWDAGIFVDVQQGLLQGATMLLGTASAALFGWVGIESNETADKRKVEEKAEKEIRKAEKIAAKEDAEYKKLAELKVKQELEAAAKAEYDAKIAEIAAKIKADADNTK